MSDRPEFGSGGGSGGASGGGNIIIIKRVKKGEHGHHGGAWKVAYADFVTAMMAFFLLLWLLNAVTEEQLNGISDYFTPISASTKHLKRRRRHSRRPHRWRRGPGKPNR